MEETTVRAARAIQEVVEPLSPTDTADVLVLNAAAFIVAYAKTTDTSVSECMITFIQQITNDVNTLIKKNRVKP